MFIVRFFTCALLALTLFGCAHNNSQGFSYQATALSNETQNLLNDQQQQINAANQLLNNNDIAGADQLLSLIDIDAFLPQTKSLMLLTQAKLSIALNQPKTAVKQLKQIKLSALNPDAAAEYQLLASDAYYGAGLPLHSAQSLIAQNNPHRDLLIWNRLQQTTPYFLNQYLKATHSTNERAWLALALASNTAENSDDLFKRVTSWKDTYSLETTLVPEELPNNLQASEQNIAVLLPLSGDYSAMGNVVKNGMMAAYFELLSQHQAVKIHFYDTNSATLKNLYKQIKADGNNVIIGPLTKEKTEELITSVEPKLPTITLNHLANAELKGNQFSFGLTPEDEATQSAELARRKGHDRALIIASNDERGHSIAAAYQRRWEALGGSVTQTAYYASAKSLSADISSLLNITDSQARLKNLERTINGRATFSATRRHDFDVIFISATSEIAEQIKPLLKFYYADEAPVYATSSTYNTLNAASSTDLSGIVFCDAPALIKPDSAATNLLANYKDTWSNDYPSYTRLFSLGHDVIMINNNINRFSALPYFPFSGMTGSIKLSPTTHRFTRELQCARFMNGTVKAFS